MKKYILYLRSDLRTDNFYYQVVGKCRKPLYLGQFIDIKIDLLDSAKEWVLCKVISINGNVFTLDIVKEVK